MKNIITYILLFAIFLTIALFELSCKNITGDTPSELGEQITTSLSFISIENKEYSIGEVNKSERLLVPFEYNLRNISDSIISINKVDVSCSCVKITDFPTQLSSGQSGIITGYIDLKNQIGHIRKSIFVSYCDSCVTILKISGDIVE